MNYKQIYLLSFIASLSIPLPANSTSIVAVWTPSEIVIAADSLSRQGGELGTTIRLSCKIFHVSNMFYALSGLSEDQETGFSAHDIVIDASRSPGKLIDKMNGFERGVLPGLRRALENIKAKYPASYQKDFAGKPGIDIIFAGVENDSLAMVVKRIGLEDFPQAGVVLQYPIENLTFDAVYIGQHDAILHFREKNPNWWQEGRRNLIKSARSLIEMQISETPLTVGPPVDTLSIELAGHRWTNLKPECREAKDK